MRQTINNLKGEIKFREKLARQHTLNEIILPDFYKKNEQEKILFDRIVDTKNKINELKDIGVNISRFLEVGSERGQRALVLTNNFNAEGFAIDISYHQLNTMEYFAGIFNMKKLPIRICCNANNLPFKSNSFPFVFGYQFLHHFPLIKPIINEVYRIIANGHFFFDEEPFKKALRIILYKKKNKIYSEKELKKNVYIKLIESFISEENCDETEHGIVENYNIPVQEWLDELSIFDEKDIELVSWKIGKVKVSNKSLLNYFLHLLLGGNIGGLCYKKTDKQYNKNIDIYDLLICPNCEMLNKENIEKSSLQKQGTYFKCLNCGFEFPIVNGIIILLPYTEFVQLYPEFLRG